jgi:hypothetical protein
MFNKIENWLTVHPRAQQIIVNVVTMIVVSVAASVIVSGISATGELVKDAIEAKFGTPEVTE